MLKVTKIFPVLQRKVKFLKVIIYAINNIYGHNVDVHAKSHKFVKKDTTFLRKVSIYAKDNIIYMQKCHKFYR